MFRRTASAALVCAAAACAEPLRDSSETVSTRVYLTDSPFPFHMIDQVNIHVVRVEATATADTTVTQTWTTVAEVNRSINVLALHSGSTALLGEAEIPAGQYRAVRMTINTAQSSVVGIDGTVWPVSWGINGQMSMYALVEAPLPVGSGSDRIVIDFDVGRSFQIAGDNLVFIPWLRAVNEAATGSVRGTITAGTSASPLPNAVVSVYGASGQTTWLVATGRTDSQGKYVVAFLRDGTYEVWVEGPATIEGGRSPCVTISGVRVQAGSEATVNTNLALDAPPCGSEGGGVDPDTTGNGGGGQPQPGGAVATVAVTLAPAPGGSVTVGDSLGFSAVIKDAQGTAIYGRPVTWTSSAPGNVEMTGSFGPFAIARAKAIGSATVTATSEGKSGSVTVEVK